MDRLAPGRLCGVDQLAAVQVRLGGRRRTDRHGDVRRAHVGRQPVRLGVHGHRLEPFLVAGADDPQGDLTPVGDEDAFESRHRLSAFSSQHAAAPG